MDDGPALEARMMLKKSCQVTVVVTGTEQRCASLNCNHGREHVDTQLMAASSGVRDVDEADKTSAKAGCGRPLCLMPVGCSYCLLSWIICVDQVNCLNFTCT